MIQGRRPLLVAVLELDGGQVERDRGQGGSVMVEQVRLGAGGHRLRGRLHVADDLAKVPPHKGNVHIQTKVLDLLDNVVRRIKERVDCGKNTMGRGRLNV